MRASAYLLAGAAVTALTTGALTASAQAQTAADTSSGFEDIIVTAQKRATNVQDTPIAIRVVEGAQIVKEGVTDVRGLARIAPDLGVTSDTLFTKIALRGVSSDNNGETGNPALTVAIDGEYIIRPVSLNAAFFDLERIEVLRGPQGTLYGRNSTAGALNIITNKPSLRGLEGSVSAGYGNYNAFILQGAVNVPLGENAAIRVSGIHNEHKGYTNNPPAGRGDTANLDAARLGVLVEPTDALKIIVQGEYVNVDQSATSQYSFPVTGTTAGLTSVVGDPRVTLEQRVDAAGNPSPTGTGIRVLNSNQLTTIGGLSGNQLLYTGLVDVPPGVNRNSYPLGSIGLFKNEQYALRGQLEYDFGGASLIYLGSYRDSKTRAIQPLSGTVAAPTLFYNNALNSKTQNHELRLSGGEEGKFIWQTGGSYFKETQFVARGFFNTPNNNRFQNFFYRPDITAKSFGFFGEATYWLTPDKLSLTAGARYSDDKASATFINFPAQAPNVLTPPAITDPGSTITYPRASSNKITWHVGLDYKPSKDSLIYAKVSTGYKAGGFDNVNKYQPETVIAYEIGTKNEFADRTIQLNASAFYYDYKNQQVSIFVDFVVGSAIRNAGKARIWGLESDLKLLATPDDIFSVTVNYLDAKLTRFNRIGGLTLTNPSAGNTLLFDLSGNRPVQAPKWTLGGGYDHTFHLGDSKVVASVYSRFKSTFFLRPQNFKGDEEGNFTQTDLTLEYVAPDDRFSIQAYVRNLEDKRPKVFASFGGGNQNFIFGAPRTYGLQGRFKF